MQPTLRTCLLPVARHYAAGAVLVLLLLTGGIGLARASSLSFTGFIAFAGLVLAALGAVIAVSYVSGGMRGSAPAAALTDPLQGLLAPFVTTDSAFEAELRREQARHITTQLDVMMAINIANALLVIVTIWAGVDGWLAAGWLCATLALAGAGLWARAKTRQAPERTQVSKRTLRRVSLHAGIRGLIWGLCFALFFGSVGPTGQLVLLSVSLGMLAGGVPALAPVPSAALLFGLGIAAPTLLRLTAMGEIDHLVLILFGVAFCGSMVMIAAQLYRNFTASLLAKRAEAEQAATISLLLNEFESSASDWLWETDRQGRMVRCPERMTSILGVTGKELGRLTLDAMLSGSSGDGRAQIAAKTNDAAAFRNVLLRCRDDQGGERWLSLTASPKPGGGYRGVGSDVTEREAARIETAAALKRVESAELRLKDGIESLGAGFILSDARDRTVIANQRLRALLPVSGLLGPDADFETIVRQQAALWFAQAPDRAEAWISDILSRRRAGAGTFDVRAPQDRWFRISSCPTSEGGTVTVLTDIGDIKQQEEMLASHSKRLAASNQELQQFAYVASHDLQEPLRKIEAFGARLKTRSVGVLDADSQHYLDRMMASSARMRRLITDLLGYSRVGRGETPFAPVDADALLAEVLDDLSIGLTETQAKVTPGRLGHIHGDTTQLRQLFQNLLANAVKFARPGVAPTVEITRASLPGGKLEVRVRDNGIGFDMRHHDRIFEIFQRLHGREAYEGTGIGLATCRKIVERHGGTLRAESTPGQGATFIIILPEPADAPVRAEPAPAVAA